MEPENKQNRQDADESIFFARDLEHKESTVYAKKYPNLKFRELFPVDNQGGPGVLTITYKMLDRVGTAQIISDYAKDFPRVNLSAKEYTAPVKGIGNSAVYSQREVDAAMHAGVNLDGEMLATARESYEKGLDQIASDGTLGGKQTGLLGFNSNPNIPVIAPTVSSGSGDDTWPNKTADEIIADVNLVCVTVVQQSKDSHAVNTIALSPERHEILKRIRLPGTAVDLLTYLGSVLEGVQFVRWSKMATAGIGGVQRLAAYQRDPEVVSFREPMPFKIYPIQQRMLEYAYPCEGRAGGVVVRYPLACVFMDGI